MLSDTCPVFYVCKIVDGNGAAAVQPVRVNKGLIPKEAADRFAPFSVFPEEESDGGSDEGLKYFKREFQHSVFPGAVYVGLAQGVSRDGNEGAKDGRAKNDRKVVSSNDKRAVLRPFLLPITDKELLCNKMIPAVFPIK